MTLCDTGPLFALMDTRQAVIRERCLKLLPTLRAPLVTTWPCLAEAMHLAYTRGRWPMQQRLWRLLAAHAIQIHNGNSVEARRMEYLMEKYRDIPMDFADASLVAAAETLGTRLVFATDSDFFVYRRHDREPFEVVPGPVPR